MAREAGGSAGAVVRFSHMKTSLLRKAALAFVFCTATLTAAESQTSLIRPDSGRTWQVSAGSGLGLFSGQVGWGVGLGISRGGGIPTPFWMGLDLAVYRFDYEGASDPMKPFAFTAKSGAATLVQMLPTFVWDIPVVGWPGLTPYVGLSVGPAVYLASGDSEAGARAHESFVGLAAYLRPGVRALLAPSLNLSLEGKVGIFRSRTVFLPQFALAWAP